jgi:2-methylcitrate dehydratase
MMSSAAVQENALSLSTAGQWDATTERLVAYAEQARYDALPPDTVHETKRRLIDTFASALGAYGEPLSEMARKVAKRSRGDVEVSVWGSTIKTTPEAAAFANGVMTRLLDISDTYLGKSRGHPSDMNSGLVALAEAVRADGKSLINAMVLAYDVYCSFCKSVDINSKGWDQPVYSVLGCVLGAGKLLGLTREQMANAVSLALTPNMALAQARRGHLSSWKGCAGANASRNAVFAALLAQDGFTGPPAVFEGDGGMWHATAKFDWTLPEGAHMIGETHIKALPVCYHGQSPVQAALEMRGRVDVGSIEEIQVDTYKTAVMMMGADPSRWAPTTHETADHSLPYCVSVALLDGKVTGESFADARLTDPAIVSLMRKVKVREDQGFSAQYPEGSPGRVSVRMMSGEAHSAEVRYPKGHFKSPMNDADVERKFRDMCEGRLGGERCGAVLNAVRDLERANDVGRDVVGLLAAND